jgi:hypothetical protein
MELDEAIRITINVRDTYDLSLEERDALALLCNFAYKNINDKGENNEN